VLCLEDEEIARARGARVLGRVLGAAATSDAHHVCAPDPSGRGAAKAITTAIADSGCSRAAISYVNAHGTSTAINDRLETAVLKAALGNENARRTPVSSTKSAIGHTLAAAGALEAIATILALNRRVVPPTVGYEEPDPECDLDYVPDLGRRLDCDAPLVALSNSFGFGGHNAALVVEGERALPCNHQAPTSA
jgi:3-oxoacyl-[acyl-carrier-protein] synthase II